MKAPEYDARLTNEIRSLVGGGKSSATLLRRIIGTDSLLVATLTNRTPSVALRESVAGAEVEGKAS